VAGCCDFPSSPKAGVCKPRAGRQGQRSGLLGKANTQPIAATAANRENRSAADIFQAVALVTMGRVDDAMPLFRRAFELDHNWAILTRAFRRSGCCLTIRN